VQIGKITKIERVLSKVLQEILTYSTMHTITARIEMVIILEQLIGQKPNGRKIQICSIIAFRFRNHFLGESFIL